MNNEEHIQNVPVRLTLKFQDHITDEIKDKTLEDFLSNFQIKPDFIKKEYGKNESNFICEESVWKIYIEGELSIKEIIRQFEQYYNNFCIQYVKDNPECGLVSFSLDEINKSVSVMNNFTEKEINENLEKNLKQATEAEVFIDVYPYSRISEHIETVKKWIEKKSPLAEEVTITDDIVKSVIDNIGIKDNDFLRLSPENAELITIDELGNDMITADCFVSIIDSIKAHAENHLNGSEQEEYRNIENLAEANKKWLHSCIWEKEETEDKVFITSQIPPKYAKLYNLDTNDRNTFSYEFEKNEQGLINLLTGISVYPVLKKDLTRSDVLDSIIENYLPMFSDNFIFHNYGGSSYRDNIMLCNSPVRDKKETPVLNSYFNSVLNNAIQKVLSPENHFKGKKLHKKEIDTILTAYNEADIYVGYDESEDSIILKKAPVTHNHSIGLLKNIHSSIKDYKNVHIKDFINDASSIIKKLSLSDDSRSFDENDEMMIETLNYHVNHKMFEKIFTTSRLSECLGIDKNLASILLETLNNDCGRNIIADHISSNLIEYYLEQNENDLSFDKKYPEFSSENHIIYPANAHIDSEYNGYEFETSEALFKIALDKVDWYINNSPDCLSLSEAILDEDKNSLAWHNCKFQLITAMNKYGIKNIDEFPSVDWQIETYNDNEVFIDGYLAGTEQFMGATTSKYILLEKYVKEYTGIKLSAINDYNEAVNNEAVNNGAVNNGAELWAGLTYKVNEHEHQGTWYLDISDEKTGRIVISEELSNEGFKANWNAKLTNDLLNKFSSPEIKLDKEVDWSHFTEEQYLRLKKELSDSIKNDSDRSFNNHYGSIYIGELAFDLYDAYYDNPREGTLLNFDCYEYYNPEAFRESSYDGVITIRDVLETDSYVDFRHLIEKNIAEIITKDKELNELAKKNLIKNWGTSEAEKGWVLNKSYDLYLTDWNNNHTGSEYSGMKPVCFEEFKDNEFKDSSYMAQILKNTDPVRIFYEKHFLSEVYKSKENELNNGKKNENDISNQIKEFCPILYEKIQNSKEKEYIFNDFLNDFSNMCKVFAERNQKKQIKSDKIAKKLFKWIPDEQRKTINEILSEKVIQNLSYKFISSKNYGMELNSFLDRYNPIEQKNKEKEKNIVR